MAVAGIVLFNPVINRLKENIESVINQVNLIVFVDNASKNITEIESLLSNYNEKAYLIKNKQNLGIAAALNQILKYVSLNSTDDGWLLTLDQDSVVFPGLVNQYERFIKVERVAMLSCIIKDRNSNLSLSMNEDFKDIEECITSGSFVNVEIMLSVGGFDEHFFIDYVDFDVCHTLRENGFRILKINFLGLLHEVGKIRNVSFLGKNEEIYNHPPFRKYYIVRNRIFFIRKHKKFIKCSREILKLLKFIVLVLFYEKNKIINIKNMFLGFIHGYLKKM